MTSRRDSDEITLAYMQLNPHNLMKLLPVIRKKTLDVLIKLKWVGDRDAIETMGRLVEYEKETKS
jgi:hypothetical protein